MKNKTTIDVYVKEQFDKFLKDNKCYSRYYANLEDKNIFTNTHYKEWISAGFDWGCSTEDLYYWKNVNIVWKQFIAKELYIDTVYSKFKSIITKKYNFNRVLKTLITTILLLLLLVMAISLNGCILLGAATGLATHELGHLVAAESLDIEYKLTAFDSGHTARVQFEDSLENNSKNVDKISTITVSGLLFGSLATEYSLSQEEFTSFDDGVVLMGILNGILIPIQYFMGSGDINDIGLYDFVNDNNHADYIAATFLAISAFQGYRWYKKSDIPNIILSLDSDKVGIKWEHNF